MDSWELDGPHEASAILARDVITRALENRSAVLVAAPRGFDCYGRIRGRIVIEGFDVGATLAANGVAWYRRGLPAEPKPPPGSPSPNFGALKCPWSHDQEARR